METVFIYFLKTNGLLLIFFFSYYFILRNETFFNKNRWFLILGLIASVTLPLVTITKIIWVGPSPVVYETVSNDFIPYIIENKVIEKPIDWNSILIYIYLGISVVFMIKILIEILSFFRIIKFGIRTKTKEAILIDNETNENPFSFFNHIVFNSQMFSEEELQHIISHENIHVKEKHSIDVLVAKVFCALFWINPIMWFYKKEMLQNLEYIADNKASKKSENTINYQKTLLKVVTNQHQLSITNQFYQSLIKKRIVMLNTNQSSKKNIWKYAVVFPLLVAFMLLFQIKTVAQVKEVEIIENDVKVIEVIEFIIDKNTTDIDLKKEIASLKEKYNIELNISKVKRNKQNEIYAIEVKFKDAEGNVGKISANGDEPIQPIRFFKELDKNGKGDVGFGGESMKTIFKQVITDGPNQVFLNDSVIEIKTIDIKSQELPNHPNKKQLYIINGKEYSSEELKDKRLELDGTIFHYFGKEAIDKFGEKGKNGVLFFDGKTTILEGNKDEINYTATEFKNIKPKNIKLKFEKGKTYFIGSKKYSFEDLKDKNWWLYTETPHKIEENNNIVTITGDVLIDAGKWNTQEVIGIKEYNPITPKKITNQNGDIIIIFNDMLKAPGYPSLKLNDYIFELNGKKINNPIKYFENVDANTIMNIKINESKLSTDENFIVEKITIQTK